MERIQGYAFQKLKEDNKVRLVRIMITDNGNIRGEYYQYYGDYRHSAYKTIAHYLNDQEVAELKANPEFYQEVYEKGLAHIAKIEKKNKKYLERHKNDN